MAANPISSDTLRLQVGVARDILGKWYGAFEQGIPGLDIPASAENMEAFFRQFCGELLVVAGICETLSSILSGDT